MQQRINNKISRVEGDNSLSAASMEQEHLSVGLSGGMNQGSNLREGGSSGASIEANDTRWRLSVMSYTNTLDMNESQVRQRR
eukprot:scaffold17266_cov78-Skeletonema_dohrnii-CCMP3373.AAC.1